ncbi:VapE domain-containing protein [uncultured Sulfitobacter sp.]|uniref:VapE domain-containing protein n=1 Tax=uncultured Sulfitobacter sp. TaxID=191468 RepID=UPI00259A7BF0|nr:VapE domain-containing protein [uncultured Sulfitobacter sp.]
MKDTLNTPSDQGFLANSEIKTLIARGASLHWLHERQKRPVEGDWSKAERYDEDQLRAKYRAGYNIGLRPGEPSKIGNAYMHVVDLDTRRDEFAEEAWTALLDYIPTARSMPSVVSGSGGASRHIYFLSDKPIRTITIAKSDGFDMVFDEARGKEVKKRHWEVSIMGTGRNIVLPPSIHPETRQPYRWERPLDLDFPALMTIPASQLLVDEITVGTATPIDWDSERQNVLEALDTITEAEDRDEWLQIGMALHSATGGGDEGFTVWCDWAERSEKFDEADSERVWQSFKGEGTGLGSLFHIAKAYGYEVPERAQIEWLPEDFDDLQVQSQPLEVGGKLRLATFANGNMKPSLSSTMFFLTKLNAERNLGLKFNEFLRNEEWLRGEVTDADQTEIKILIEQAGITFAPSPLHSVSKSDANDAIAALSRKHPYHPVRDWLSSLHHDGQRRAETLFIDYLGCPDTPYFRDTARLLLVAAVARIFEPGHKFDFAPIIEGAQGIRKSTFVKTLCPRADWYGDPQIDWSEDKHVLEQTQGIWLLELGELTGLRKAEVNVIKAAISRTHDKAREAYGRKSQRVARQFVMIGTTNDRDYLVDDENRRFWPIPAQVEQIDTERLAREIPSIWAEAVAIYKQMRTEQPEGPLPLHLTGDAESHARRLQKSRRKESESDVLAGQIEHWLNTPLGDGFDDLDAASMQPTYRDEVCGLAVWREMLGNKGVPPQSELTKIGRAIASLGWIKEGRKRHPEYGQQIIHRRPTS